MSTREDLSGEPLDERDGEILAAVARLFEALDPVPAGLVDDVAFALTAQALHAEVAQLQLLVPSAATRSDHVRTETLTFRAAALSVMVQVSPLAVGAVRVDGWVAGHEGPVEVELRGVDVLVRTTSDPDGRFTLEPAPRGLACFVFTPTSGGRPVATPAVEI